MASRSCTGGTSLPRLYCGDPRFALTVHPQAIGNLGIQLYIRYLKLRSVPSNPCIDNLYIGVAVSGKEYLQYRQIRALGWINSAHCGQRIRFAWPVTSELKFFIIKSGIKPKTPNKSPYSNHTYQRRPRLWATIGNMTKPSIRPIISPMANNAASIVSQFTFCEECLVIHLNAQSFSDMNGTGLHTVVPDRNPRSQRDIPAPVQPCTTAVQFNARHL